MNREKVIQTLMNQKKYSRYLEIGVFSGHIFFRVKSKFKIAVDPDFQFSEFKKAAWLFLNPNNFYNKYFEKLSDVFFNEDAPGILSGIELEIALIDGMHEYSYALNDVVNTLQYLSKKGVIILHDCNPQKKEHAVSFAEWKTRDFKNTWNGDVWRTVLHLRSLRNDINVFTLDCDQGLGIITFGKPENPLHYTKEEIEEFSFEDFEANRESWLNLKPVDYFYEYFNLTR